MSGELMFGSMSLAEVALRLVSALVLGAVVGWNRERIGKPAGLRTHMMVSLGAATFVMLGLELVADYGNQPSQIRLDPTRVIQGVVGGIGFLGAGSIIQSRRQIEGITTAASVWVAGALGTACGVGVILLAGLTTLLALMTLAVLAPLEHRLRRGSGDD